MSDSVDNPTPTPTPAPPAAPEPAQSEPKAADEIPDWGRKQIADANGEAAKYRVQLREAQTALSSANEKIASLTADHATVSSSLTERQGEFDKLATAVQTLYPDSKVFAFAKTLQGSNDEELANHAAELNEMFGISSGPVAAVDRSQGHGSGTPASDPASEFAALLQANLTR